MLSVTAWFSKENLVTYISGHFIFLGLKMEHKYLVLKTINQYSDNLEWEISISNLSIEDFVEQETRAAIYGGDENGIPEDYKKIDKEEQKFIKVEIIDLDDCEVFKCDLKQAIENHNNWHDEREDKISREKDYKLYLELRKKFEGEEK